MSKPRSATEAEYTAAKRAEIVAIMEDEGGRVLTSYAANAADIEARLDDNLIRLGYGYYRTGKLVAAQT